MNIDAPKAASVPEAISSAMQSGMQLNLGVEDIAFLSGIATYVELQQSFSLTASDLEKIFTILNDMTHGNEDYVSQRTINATERLIKNQVLIRVDGGGMSYRPLYDLTQLGKAIVRFMSENEKLTRQNLAIITARIIAFLAEIRKSIESGGSDGFWEEKVLMPLECIVSELLGAIEKRQRGLDLEQNQVRTEISQLLEKGWMEAIDACESLLSTTSETLQELYRTILSENTAIKHALNELYEKAESNSQHRVQETVDTIYHRLDQLEQWGKERVASWSQYFRRVNDFLQSIVQFDPNRELSQKLKTQIQSYPAAPWFIGIISASNYRTIREINLSAPKARIVRPIKDASRDDTKADDDGNLVLDLMIEDLKTRLKENREINLKELVIPFLKEHSLEKVYPHIGTLTDLILKESKVKPNLDFDWEKPLEELEMELQNLQVKS